MSNYYAKAINPRTKQIEQATMLDTSNGFFLAFEDGWKYNLKENPNMVITEQEAINQDGEEIMEQWDSIYNLNPDAYDKAMKTREVFEDEVYPNFFDYSFNWKWKFVLGLLTLGFLTVLVSGIVSVVSVAMDWIGI